jgi:hypothetical protein
MLPRKISSTQTIGNIGLYYVCYRLSLYGWNVMPTARNARGIDVLIYNEIATVTKSIQVKALSKDSPVPLGKNLYGIFGDFVIVCRRVTTSPECFIITPDEVRALAHKGDKNNKTSYWLQPKKYATDEFREKWDRIGHGLFVPPPSVTPPAVPLSFGRRLG